MDYDRAAHGDHGGGIKVKMAVVVFPGRNGRGDMISATEVIVTTQAVMG